MARFVHRSMASETVKLAVRIETFSQVIRSGSYECREFGEDVSDSRWSLEVNGSDADDNENFIDIYLRRSKFDGAEQFVELKLTVDDRFGLWGLSEKRPLSFKGSTNVQKVMSVRKSWFSKLLFAPNDTLTIRGEMTIYKDVERDFTSESEFENNVRKSGTVPNAVVSLIVGLLILLVAVIGGGYVVISAINYIILSVVVPFLYNIVLPFIVILLVATWLFGRLHEGMVRTSKNRQTPKYRMLWVPVQNGEYWQNMDYYPRGNRKYSKQKVSHGYY